MGCSAQAGVKIKELALWETNTDPLWLPQRNTFQLVIASDGAASYAILLYPSDGMQFLSTPSVGRTEPMQAGFGKGLVKFLIWSTRQGPYERITTDEEESVRKLSE